MRIVFLAGDDEYAGAMQKSLYEQHPDWIVGSVISSSVIYKKSTTGAAWFLIRRCGFFYFAEMVRMKIMKKLISRKKPTIPSILGRRHKVDLFYSANVNSEESLGQLASWKPDVIISTNFGHYIGKKARESAATGTWNLHKSLLPHYRGMSPNFYALLEGAGVVGATLHLVAKDFDTGDILVQTEVPVREDDTVYMLNKRTAEAGGEMLNRFLEDADLNNLAPRPQPDGDWRNYSYPTRVEIKQFRGKGLRF